MTSSASPKRNDQPGKRLRGKAPSDDEKRFERTKEIWTAITAKSLELRDAEREFHGFQGELRRIGAGIKDQYEKSRSIKHVRDLGEHREELIKIFFQESGLLPFGYGVSQTSSRVIGSSGHSSKEIDILFFERNSNIILRKFGKTLEFYPAETVLGVIQIKSKLTYTEIDSAFDNIASYKKIYDFKEGVNLDSNGRRGFGVILAFETDLSHGQIVSRIELNAEKYPPKDLPNSIIILGGSTFRFGDRDGGYLFNNKIDNITDLQVWGDLNVSGDTFYRFYGELIELLRNRRPQQISLPKYFDLPLVSDGISYRFQYGANAETMKCPSHGDYLRRFSEGSAAKVFEIVQKAEPIHWIRALDIARGKAGDDLQSYEKQPGEVKIYNPEDLSLDNLLMSANGTLRYDDLNMNGLIVWIPWWYAVKESLFAECPSCQRAQRTRTSRR